MKHLIRICALVSIPLLLAGCFRSAGDTIAPTPEASLIAAGDAAVDAAATALDATSAPLDNAGQSTSPTVPPITILPPNTRQPTAGSTTVESGTTESGGVATTRAPGTIVPPPTETPQFITPGSPMGAVPFDTSVPQVAGSGTRTGSGAALTSGTPSAEETAAVAEECLYIVEAGNSLYAIAIANDTTIEDILAVNPTLEDEEATLFPGDELILPDCDEDTATAEPEPTARATQAGTPAPGEVYEVQPGDTLFNIAQRYGFTIAEIVAVNPDINPDVLAIGQEIILPAEED